MKKLLCVVLALCMLAGLAFPVFAEEDSIVKEIVVTGLTSPVANENIPKDPLKDAEVKLTATVKGEDQPQELTPVASAFWAETDKPKNALTDGKFVAGRSYRINITLEFQDAAPQIHSKDTKLTINGEELKLDGKAAGTSSEGEKLTVYTDYKAAPASYEPKVTLKTTKDVTTKVYDGEGLVLTAEVGEVDGIQHRYEWYRNDKLLENETQESITLVNVADSGDYFCKVYAKAATDKNADETSTKSPITVITITPCKVTVNIHDIEKNVFETEDPEFTYDVFDANGKAPYDLDKLTGKPERKEGSAIGKYTISIGTLAFADEVKDNYEVIVNEGTLEIVKDDQTPFIPVSSIGDLVKISGANGSKIQISAPKGAIPEDAVLTLDFMDDTAKAALEKQYSKKILKGFTVKLQDKDGKALEFSKEATLRIQIPLTEEEAKTFDVNSILAVLYVKNGTKVDAKVIKNKDATYLAIEISSLGSVALMEGKKVTPPVSSTEKTAEPKEEEKKSLPLWVWIVISVATLGAIAAIVITLVVIRKKKEKATRAYIPKSRSSSTPVSVAPVEDTKTPEDDAMKTRPVPIVEKEDAPAEEAKTKTRIIPFEDLE